MKLLVNLLFFVLFILKSNAQTTIKNTEELDSADLETRKSILISDFNNSDVVVLLKITNCIIVDSIGDYTNQLVFGDVLKTHKGYFSDRFYAMVETKKQWQKVGDTVGFFLTSQDPNMIKDIHYSWIENSGFKTSDTIFLETLSNKKTLQQEIKNRVYSDKDNSPQWIKAYIKKYNPLIHRLEYTFKDKTIEIIPIENSENGKFKKGKTYKIMVRESSYGGYHLKYILQTGKVFEFPIYKGAINSIPETMIEYVFPLNNTP